MRYIFPVRFLCPPCTNRTVINLRFLVSNSTYGTDLDAAPHENTLVAAYTVQTIWKNSRFQFYTTHGQWFSTLEQKGWFKVSNNYANSERSLLCCYHVYIPGAKSWSGYWNVENELELTLFQSLFWFSRSAERSELLTNRVGGAKRRLSPIAPKVLAAQADANLDQSFYI